ncbi:MAG: exodeoxyribonuclease VII small subunit [Thermomicrobiales bacterium]
MDERERFTAIGKTLDAWDEIALNGSFEDAMDALEAIVTLLDEGDLTLDLSVRCFETGTRLSARCQSLLEQAELRISLLSSTPQQYDDYMVEVTIDIESDND